MLPDDSKMLPWSCRYPCLWLALASSPKSSQLPDRCSPNFHFHVRASEAERSEAVLTCVVLLALILLDTLLHAFQVFQYLSALPVPTLRQVFPGAAQELPRSCPGAVRSCPGAVRTCAGAVRSFAGAVQVLSEAAQ